MTYPIRSFSATNDIPAWLCLLMESEAVDQGGNPVDEEALRAQLGLPGHDPEQDRWVIPHPDDPATLIGCALVWLPPETTTAKINILIHPDWRRRGLGSQLFGHTLQRSRSLGGQSIQAQVGSKDPGPEAFLHKLGFKREGAYHELRKEIPTRLPTPVWPYGYKLCTYADIKDISALTYAMNVCYDGLWGHQEVSEQQITSWLPQYNHDSLFLVYSPSGKLVGICRVEAHQQRSANNQTPTGYIDAPGFHHHHRRMDLYRAFVLTGMHWLQKEKQKIVEMESWGDKLEILNLYRDMGFDVLRRLVSYQLPL